MPRPRARSTAQWLGVSAGGRRRVHKAPGPLDSSSTRGRPADIDPRMRESFLEFLRAPCESGASTSGDLTLRVFAWDGEVVEEGVLVAPDGRWWWVAEGVPRMLPAALYRNPSLEERYRSRLDALGLAPAHVHSGSRRGRTVESRTIDRFGAEWIRYRDWGHRTAPPQGADLQDWRGGLWENTLSAFCSKTFLDDKVSNGLVLDAGCGNGRFVAASLHFGARTVIGVDIGWGVDMAHQRFRSDPRVHLVQASLFELPIGMVDIAFSLGVLMHTGNARRAYLSVARRVRPGGLMAARLYHRGNWAHEVVDGSIRAVTTRLTKGGQIRFARAMASFGRAIEKREASNADRAGLRMRWYQVLRNWPTEHHNLDWWSAPVATHHTAAEVATWAQKAGLVVERSAPPTEASRFGFWNWPEALTLLARRPAAIERHVAEESDLARPAPFQRPQPVGR